MSMEWTPQKPSPGFASRTVDAMLADREPRRVRRLAGPMGLILAAALVATTAVGMYRARKQLPVPVVNVVVIPEVKLPAPAPPPPAHQRSEVALEPESIKAVVVRPRPPKPPAKQDDRAEVPTPRCDCLSDVAVCGCIE